MATTARRLVPGGVALAFFWFSSAIVLPRLAAAPGHSALATLPIVGAVLLIDSGDAFQGDAASNLSEGAVVVDAYNAMGYTAAAVRNHDFDFGSVDSPTARQLPGDLRGALNVACGSFANNSST